MQIRSSFQESFSSFPSEAVEILEKLVRQEGMLEAGQVAQLKAVTGLELNELMVKLLPVAATLSVTPISHFDVGVIVEGVSGALYLGTNLEFNQQPLKVTVHAEQFAITHAWHKGEQGIKRLVVNEAPCGHCRQFINELHNVENLEIVIHKAKAGTCISYSISDLLPAAFGPADLGVKDKLLSPQARTLSLPDAHNDDELAQAALKAAAESYAPVSQNWAGVALKLKSGRIVTGRYGENAAFNPSITAIEAALVNWRLALMTQADDVIVDAVVVEQPTTTSQKDLVSAFLSGYDVQPRCVQI